MNKDFYPEKDVSITYRRYTIPSYMTPGAQILNPHFHYQYEMILVTEGASEFVIENHIYSLMKGSILFISNHENHHIQSNSDNFSRYTLRFSSEIVATYLRDPMLLSVFQKRPDNFCHLYQCSEKKYQQFLNLCKLMEIEYNNQKPYWAQMIASKLLTILVDIYRSNSNVFPISQNTEKQMLIFNVQNYIELHSHEELSLDFLANKFYVSKYHLSHAFSGETGYTLKEFLTMTRISKAKEQLLLSGESISLIGQKIGFHDNSNFIRTFKKYEGLSPLQYRNQMSRQTD